MLQVTCRSRVEAAFICMAVTDALGAPLEFGPRKNDSADYVASMLPNDNFNLPAGHFTDDTSMALALAMSLISNKGKTNAASQAQVYLQWYRHGWMSSLPGKCFDIGVQTRETLHFWEGNLQPGDHGTPGSGSDILAMIDERYSKEMNCGNGSLMRVLPCALVAKSEDHAIKLARESSAVTHPHTRCADACEIYTSLVYRALQGVSKDSLVSTLVEWCTGPYSDKVDETLRQRFKAYSSISTFNEKDRSSISSSGYVVDTLEAALWAFFSTDSYEEGAIRAVNLGDDSDTVGAVYGGLAGAFYGHEDVIPKKWVKDMKGLLMVRGMVERIVKVAAISH